MACEGQVRDYAIILVDKYIGQSYAEVYVNLYVNIDRHSISRVSNILSWNTIVFDVQRICSVLIGRRHRSIWRLDSAGVKFIFQSDIFYLQE